jgi:hypothetical protein
VFVVGKLQNGDELHLTLIYVLQMQMERRTTRSQSALRETVLRDEVEEQKEEIALSILKTLKETERKAKEISIRNSPLVQINQESGRKRGENCIYKVSGTAVYEFKELGFDKYLARSKLKDATVDGVVNMFSQFITFVKQSACRKQVQSMHTRQIMWWVIDNKRNLFAEYIDALSSKASSKRKRIEAIIHAVAFLDINHSGQTKHDYGDATRALDRIRQQFTQAARAELRDPVRSVAHLISINGYPRGGLADIRKYLDQGWEYFDALVAAAQAGYQFNEEQYLECLRYVLATLWGYDDNARGLAIERVNVGDVALALEHHDFVLSQHFKTYGHYEYQTVKFSRIIQKVWMPFIRSQVASKTNCDRVFLSYSGKALSTNDASRHVHKWFLRYGLVVNVTILRKVLEASYAEAEAKEVISRDAHDSLTKSQGHTAQTAKTYYDIVGKEAAMGIVSALDNTAHYETVCTSLAPHLDSVGDLPSRVDAILSRHSSHEGLLDWNAFGDSYTGKSNALCTRYEWTIEELGWLRGWFLSHGPDTPNRYAACLQDLREAPRHIKAVFHPHHVFNSDRLKTGAQRVERELEREKKE